MIESIYYSTNHSAASRDLTDDEIRSATKNPDGLLWVNLCSPTLEESNHVLTDLFQFHPLAVEDCQSIGYQTPKIDDFGAYIFIIAHALPVNRADISAENSMELNIFVADNYLVTSYNREIMPPVEDGKKRLDRDDRLIKNGPDFLCHAILDHLVDDYMPLLDELDEHLELLEDRVLEKPTPEILSELIEQKHMLMALRRIISPQREIINRLSRDDYTMIDRQSRIYYRDIYDHLVRIQDLSESLRDIVSGVMDIYLNSTSMRLNEVMKALTVVSTIFLPLSFVAGVYGMNFHYMPELAWRFGYLFVWVIFVSIFVGMLVWFKRRNWF
ncbi:MAG TPA: magnesium/cobalt transporter CorA [Anaerolinea sp.]|nr:magnesium/cobalt transporter CorA [Anaerolinea sp.]